MLWQQWPLDWVMIHLEMLRKLEYRTRHTNQHLLRHITILSLHVSLWQMTKKTLELKYYWRDDSKRNRFSSHIKHRKAYLMTFLKYLVKRTHNTKNPDKQSVLIIMSLKRRNKDLHYRNYVKLKNAIGWPIPDFLRFGGVRQGFLP